MLYESIVDILFPSLFFFFAKKTTPNHGMRPIRHTGKMIKLNEYLCSIKMFGLWREHCHRTHSTKFLYQFIWSFSSLEIISAMRRSVTVASFLMHSIWSYHMPTQ